MRSKHGLDSDSFHKIQNPINALFAQFSLRVTLFPSRMSTSLSKELLPFASIAPSSSNGNGILHVILLCKLVEAKFFYIYWASDPIPTSAFVLQGRVVEFTKGKKRKKKGE